MNECGVTCVDLIIAQPKGKLKFTPLSINTVWFLHCLIMHFLWTFVFDFGHFSSKFKQFQTVWEMIIRKHWWQSKLLQLKAVLVYSLKLWLCLCCHLLPFIFFSFTLSHTCSHMIHQVSSFCSSSLSFSHLLSLYTQFFFSLHALVFLCPITACIHIITLR